MSATIVIVAIMRLCGIVYTLSEVGTSDNDQIVGGHNTTIEQHPYVVALHFDSVPSCAGSLIRPDIVLTAAHCFDMYTEINLFVTAGNTLYNSNNNPRNVKKFYRHPRYSSEKQDYDVALLYLDKKYELSETIQTIDLWPVRNSEFGEETAADFVGWGMVENQSVKMSMILQEVRIPYVMRARCKEMYSRLYNAEITSRMICFGSKSGGKDACHGDSGGPGVVDGKQVAIISWGEECGHPQYPGVSTDVSNEEIAYFIEWCIANFANTNFD